MSNVFLKKTHQSGFQVYFGDDSVFFFTQRFLSLLNLPCVIPERERRKAGDVLRLIFASVNFLCSCALVWI